MAEVSPKVQPVRLGVLGCGNVCAQYLPNLLNSPQLEVVAVADVLAGRAKAIAEQFSISAWSGPDGLLARTDVELVVNLTNISTHVEVSAAALAAGKHVYSEKPLSVDLSDALRLLDEARRLGLTLACAPDTLLGAGFQAARAALREGRIGTPLVVSAVMLRSALGPSPYTEGANPFFDMAPYYLSALVNLFGPVRRLTGFERALDASGSMSLSGTLEFPDGVVGHLSLAWGSGHQREVPAVSVYGTEGAMAVPNPNTFGDPAFVRPYGAQAWEELKGSRQPGHYRRNLRGLGVAEMARAIRKGRTPRAHAELAAHVVEVISGLVASAESQRHLKPTTTCRPADPLGAQERDALLLADAG